MDQFEEALKSPHSEGAQDLRKEAAPEKSETLGTTDKQHDSAPASKVVNDRQVVVLPKHLTENIEAQRSVMRMQIPSQLSAVASEAAKGSAERVPDLKMERERSGSNSTNNVFRGDTFSKKSPLEADESRVTDRTPPALLASASPPEMPQPSSPMPTQATMVIMPAPNQDASRQGITEPYNHRLSTFDVQNDSSVVE